MTSPIRLTVRLTPKGGRDALCGWSAGPDAKRYLSARVSAAPSDGKANEALLRLIARELGIGATRVRIVSGAKSRMKIVEVDGITALPPGFGDAA